MMGERETPSSPSTYITLKSVYNRISFEDRFTRKALNICDSRKLLLLTLRVIIFICK
jgi:hypothetical protein